MRDMITFPWEEEETPEDELPTDEEIETMRRQLQAENAKM
jgi:hypothetical protein